MAKNIPCEIDTTSFILNRTYKAKTITVPQIKLMTNKRAISDLEVLDIWTSFSPVSFSHLFPNSIGEYQTIPSTKFAVAAKNTASRWKKSMFTCYSTKAYYSINIAQVYIGGNERK